MAKRGRTLQAVILDWAGTTLDYGCYAPTMVFVDVFRARGVDISLAEARAPMGMYKCDHIAAITRMPAVIERWQAAHRRPPNADDVQAMFEDSIPRQIACIAQYADLIPGVSDTINAFRQQGLKIGSTTGYTREMMAVLLPEAKKRGYEPDSLVCPDEVRAGRPAPWMCFQNAMNLDVYPMPALVKIGDTIPDILEGSNAGMWTIGLAKTGNEIGLNAQEIEELAPDALQLRLTAAYKKLSDAGAHYVVDSLNNTLPILDEINERLAQGEKP